LDFEKYFKPSGSSLGDEKSETGSEEGSKGKSKKSATKATEVKRFVHSAPKVFFSISDLVDVDLPIWIQCVLCPSNKGEMIPTEDGQWAHRLCASLVPGTHSS
jgi:hypothetical protein